MTSCENQQLKSAVVCIDTWLAWLEMCWLHRMLAVFSGCLCSLLPCVYLWHAYVILLHVKPTILDKFRPSPTPPPPQSRERKWLILAFARLYPWFRGEGGGVRVCRYFFFCPRLQSWTKLTENLAPPPSQNHGWENDTSWLRRGFILDSGGAGVCSSFYCV